LLTSVWGIGTFAHITDLHYDTQYKVGVSTLGYCRTTDIAGTSGRFGTQSNRCDSPRALIKETLVHIATRKPKVDFVLVTGDLARRTRGGETRNQTDQLAELTDVSDLLASLVAEPMIVLPSIGGSDLWPEGDCLGNDTQFATLQTATWETFLRPWMLDDNNKNSFLQYGCYNATINGFGIIILNTEFWSFSNGAAGASANCDDGRVGHQVFIWAESVLKGYKQAGMKVLIAGNRKYSDEYGESNGYRLPCLARYVNMSVVYEDTILGHVYGGGHEDSFTLIQNNIDFRKPNVTGVIHVSPAVLPVYNPSIRIYEYAMPGGSLPAGTLTDYVQYYADLVQANRAFDLTFQEEYRATTAYELPDFSTASWLNLFNKIETDPVWQEKYDSFKTVSSDSVGPTPAPPPDTLIGVVFTVICGVVVVLAGGLAWFKCRSFKYKTYEQELAEGLK